MKTQSKIKHFIKSLFAVLIILCLAGCAALFPPADFTGTDLGVYDKTVPPENQCTLRIQSTLTVKKFDDKTVRWRNKANSNHTYKIRIPEGKHTFLVNYEVNTAPGNPNYNKRYWKNNLPLQYNFEAGKEYIMTVHEGESGLGQTDRIINLCITLY